MSPFSATIVCFMPVKHSPTTHMSVHHITSLSKIVMSDNSEGIGAFSVQLSMSSLNKNSATTQIQIDNISLYRHYLCKYLPATDKNYSIITNIAYFNE